jgi:hypothetical protein
MIKFQHIILACCLHLAVGYNAKEFPQRSNNESALLEWGHSALIQAADAVVAQFGLQTWEEEFKLGIEASPIFANPPHGCQPLSNSKQLKSQVVGVYLFVYLFVLLPIFQHISPQTDHIFRNTKTRWC